MKQTRIRKKKKRLTKEDENKQREITRAKNLLQDGACDVLLLLVRKEIQGNGFRYLFGHKFLGSYDGHIIFFFFVLEVRLQFVELKRKENKRKT